MISVSIIQFNYRGHLIRHSIVVCILVDSSQIENTEEVYMINLIWKYIIKNYKKNLALITVLAISICVVFANATAKKSQLEYIKDVLAKNRPKAEVIYNNLNFEQISKISKNKDVDSYTKVRTYGVVTYSNRLTEDLIEFDQKYFEQYNLTLVEGRLPINKNEVIVFEDFFKLMNLKIGQKINIEGYNKFKNKEKSVDVENYKLDVKVVGYYTCPEVMKTFFIDSSIMLARGEYDIVKNISYKGTIDFKEGLKPYIASMKLSSDLNVNSDHIYIDNTHARIKEEEARLFSDKDSMDWAFMVLGAFMTMNIISLMASQISREQGLLRVIAMSKRRILLFEFMRNVFLLFVSVVLGLIMGLPLSRIFTRFFSYSSIDISMAHATISYDWVCMKNVVILLALVMMLSVAIPSIKVLSNTPIQQYKGLKNNVWGRFTNNLVNNIFSEITNRLLVTSILKQKVFLVVSSVIIVFAGHTYVHNYSFPTYWKIYISPLERSFRDYDIRLSQDRFVDNFRTGYTSDDVKKISSIGGVKDVFARSNSEAYMYVKPNQLSDQYKAQRLLDDNFDKGEIRFDLLGMPKKLIQDFINKDNVLERGHLPSDKAENGIVEALVYNTFYLKMDERGNFKVIKNLSIGDIINLRIENYNKKTGKISYQNQKFKVVGLLDDIWGSFFDTEAFVPDILVDSKAYAKITGSEYMSRVEIRTRDKSDIKRVFKGVKNFLGYKQFFKAETLEGIIDDLEWYHRIAKKRDFVTTLILFALAITNIIVGIILSFYMRKNEYGSLLSLGMRRRTLKSICIKNTVLVVIPGIVGIYLWSLRDAIFEFESVKMCAMQQGIPFNEYLYIPWCNLLAFTLVCIMCMLVAGFILAKKIDKINIMDMINSIE